LVKVVVTKFVSVVMGFMAQVSTPSSLLSELASVKLYLTHVQKIATATASTLVIPGGIA